MKDKALSVKAMMNSLRVCSLTSFISDLPDLNGVSVLGTSSTKGESGEPQQINSLFIPQASLDCISATHLPDIAIGELGGKILLGLLPRDLLSLEITCRTHLSFSKSVPCEKVWLNSIQLFFGPTTAGLKSVAACPRKWYVQWRKRCLGVI